MEESALVKPLEPGQVGFTAVSGVVAVEHEVGVVGGDAGRVCHCNSGINTGTLP